MANSLRTLNCIGWQHAEPVLRSLAYALLKHEGDNPAKRDETADRPWRRNLELAQKIRADWLEGKTDAAATPTCWPRCDKATRTKRREKVVELLNRGVAPQSIWDALFVGAGELLVRQPGIVALHAVTTTNALRYAWDTSASDDTRRMLLLQNAAFLPMFRQAMGGQRQDRPAEAGRDCSRLPAAASGRRPWKRSLPTSSRDKMNAAGKTLAYLQSHPEPHEFIDAARLLIFLKGSNAHDYKFSRRRAGGLPERRPQCRGRFLASSVFNLRGSSGNDNQLVERTRTALG